MLKCNFSRLSLVERTQTTISGILRKDDAISPGLQSEAIIRRSGRNQTEPKGYSSQCEKQSNVKCSSDDVVMYSMYKKVVELEERNDD